MDEIGTVRREDMQGGGYLLWVLSENDYGRYWLSVYATPDTVTMVNRVHADGSTIRESTSVVGAIPCTPAAKRLAIAGLSGRLDWDKQAKRAERWVQPAKGGHG